MQMDTENDTVKVGVRLLTTLTGKGMPPRSAAEAECIANALELIVVGVCALESIAVSLERLALTHAPSAVENPQVDL